MSLDLNLRTVTNLTLFIYHYVKAKGLVLWYNYTTLDSDPSQSYFVMQSTLAGSSMHTGQIFVFAQTLFKWSMKYLNNNTRFLPCRRHRERAGENTTLACSCTGPFYAPRSSSSADNDPAKAAKVIGWETLKQEGKTNLLCLWMWYDWQYPLAVQASLCLHQRHF